VGVALALPLPSGTVPLNLVVMGPSLSTGTAREAAGPHAPSGPRPLKVGVLVDLALTPKAGGHVKCWERFAQAATRHAGELDLTVHFSGAADEVRTLSDSVRFRLHPPRFSTARLSFLSHVPDHTDLARYHPGVARHLAGYDVIHTTDAYFAFARTALKVARRLGIPLVNSVHTDTPSYTRVFTSDIIERRVGRGVLGRVMLNHLSIPERLERRMRRQLLRHQGRCAYALVSRTDDVERAAQALPRERVAMLRRGIDRDAFSPALRDREWLERQYGIPRDRRVVLFVGRLNRGKNILTLAEALKPLITSGAPLHLLCAGQGDDRQAILDLLGPRATCPGIVEPPALARMYASADLFAMCSEIEVFCNVVQEALASGLPVLLAERCGVAWLMKDGETGVIVRGPGPEPWSAAIRELCADGERLARMGRAARSHAERALATWDEVLVQDLLPIWRRAAAERVRPREAAV
jgi:glycosyltransferase involved in cell wall biosynthesis